MTAHIPEGITSVEAFDALYKNADVVGMGKLNPSAGKAPRTLWNAIQIFKNECFNGYCDYVRGKFLKVGFNQFPKLDVRNYDNYYGQGAAQKAIDTYQNTMSEKSDSKEQYDLNCDPCKYFTSYWKEKTPFDQRKDLEGMFTKCELLEEAGKQYHQN